MDNLPLIVVIDTEWQYIHECLLVRLPDTDGDFWLVSKETANPWKVRTKSLDYTREDLRSQPDLSLLIKNFAAAESKHRDWNLVIDGKVVATMYRQEQEDED